MFLARGKHSREPFLISRARASHNGIPLLTVVDGDFGGSDEVVGLDLHYVPPFIPSASTSATCRTRLLDCCFDNPPFMCVMQLTSPVKIVWAGHSLM